MGAKIFWTLSAPSPRRAIADGLTDLRAAHFSEHDLALHVARAAEVSGLDGVFIPWTPAGDEPWIVAASLARHTRRVALLPEIQIPFATPVYLAKMSVSFQRLAQRRLAWSFDLGRSEDVRQGLGDWLGGDEWYARADEYLRVLAGVWRNKPYDFRGHYYDVEAGGFEPPLSGLPLPPIYTSGESGPALALAAKHADVHVLGAGPRLAQRARHLRDAAREHGRNLQVGLRLGVLSRHTEEEARQEAGSSAIDLVGSHGQVAEGLRELATSGIDHLIIGARADLAEAYRFGEHVLPLLHPAAKGTRSAPTAVSL